MTFDTATFKIQVAETAPDTSIPYTDSDELHVEVEGSEDGVLTVHVNGDAYGISQFQTEVMEREWFTIESCDTNIGGGEPQPADIRRMEG